MTLGAPQPDVTLVRRALALAALGSLDPELPVSVTGSGLSGEQAARVLAARAIYRGVDRFCPDLVFDEPSTPLDSQAEAQ